MENWKKDFLEQDILDDFDIFMEYGEHKKMEYSLDEVINEFIFYINKDIQSIYQSKSIQADIKKYIRGICYKNKRKLFDKYGK